ncbi:relaxin-3 receptor 1-like [Vanacampus margaritifer]
MSSSDHKRMEFFRNFLNGCGVDMSCNSSHLLLHHNDSSYTGGLELAGDGSPWLRILISVVYFAVATAGVVGNLLVLFLLYSTRTITTGTINFFVFNLALAHLLFSLALPFWAMDIALDYSWPFGAATCKAVSLLTGLNVFASCFFLTAMSLTRYCYVAAALKPRASPCGERCTSPAVTALIWAAALVAATPRAVFADLRRVGSGNDTACLLRFPDGTAWLGINQLLRVVLGFLLPYGTIILSYLLLLRFLCRHKLKGSNSRRKADISKSVAVVVLSFCACWFPYNILTLWSVLIQLDIVDISPFFYGAQTYFFPLANCLAFTSSCFNPVIYCLVRKEYRAALHNIIFKLNLAVMSKMPYAVNADEGSEQAGQMAIPLSNMPSQTSQSDLRRYIPLSTLPTVVSTL